jgi:hypothetical protein
MSGQIDSNHMDDVRVAGAVPVSGLTQQLPIPACRRNLIGGDTGRDA